MTSGVLVDAIEIEGEDWSKICGCASICVPGVGQASIELVVE